MHIYLTDRLIKTMRNRFLESYQAQLNLELFLEEYYYNNHLIKKLPLLGSQNPGISASPVVKIICS